MDLFFKKYKINIEKVGLIKVDIENHEYQLLQGFKKLSLLPKGCKLIIEIQDYNPDREKTLNLIKKEFKLENTVNGNYLFTKK